MVAWRAADSGLDHRYRRREAMGPFEAISWFQIQHQRFEIALLVSGVDVCCACGRTLASLVSPLHTAHATCRHECTCRVIGAARVGDKIAKQTTIPAEEFGYVCSASCELRSRLGAALSA